MALYPSTSLYPSTTLYPNGSTTPTINTAASSDASVTTTLTVGSPQINPTVTPSATVGTALTVPTQTLNPSVTGGATVGTAVTPVLAPAVAAGATITTSVALANRKNLFRAPSAEGAVNPWTVTGTSVAITTDQAAFGTHSYAGASDGTVLNLDAYMGTSGMPVTAGRTYTVSAYVRAKTNSRLAYIQTTFRDASGASVGGGGNGSANDSTTGWTRISQTDTAPAGAVQASVSVWWGTGLTAGEVHYVDGLLFEEGGLQPYFDGSFAADGTYSYSWTATANDSASQATYNTAPVLSPSITPSGTVTTALTVIPGLAPSVTPSVAVSTSLSAIGAPLTPAVTASATVGTALSTVQSITTTTTPSVVVGTALTVIGASTLTPAIGPEATVTTEFVYDPQPIPLEDRPLGKLLDNFTVATSATPTGVADQIGGVPVVGAAFTAGRNPETAMGTEATILNPSIGEWSGQVSNVQTSSDSNIVGIGIDTPLTRLGKDLRAYPVIGDVSVWTHARAIEYWTQQARFFNRDVPGSVAFYQSCWGHGYAYGDGLSGKRLLELGAVPAVSNGRSWLSYTASSTVAVVDGKTHIPVHAGTQKLAAGVTFNGAGSASTTFAFDGGRSLKLSTTGSAVTATLNGTTVASVSASGVVDAIVSVRRLSDTAAAVRLTAGTADSGILTVSTSIPATVYLEHVDHAGSNMLRGDVWLTVADRHPLPGAVRKSFAPVDATRAIGLVSGWNGNTWTMIQEFCAVHRLDLTYSGGVMSVGPRSAAITQAGPLVIHRTATARERYRQVAVTNLRSTVGTNIVLWRADQKIDVSARAFHETTVSTGHSILELNQPQPVTALSAFPYTSGGGEYVVKGADGTTVDPAWWTANGGKVTVSLTDKDGEILVRVDVPGLDVPAAPYHLTFGPEDRPALYVTGTAIINSPQLAVVATAEGDGREGYDRVFDSPFLATSVEAYAAAMDLAVFNSSAGADYTVDDIPAAPGGTTRLGTSPAGARIHDGKRILRVTHATQKASGASLEVHERTTWGDVMADHDASATFADEFARHATFKDSAISPLLRTV